MKPSQLNSNDPGDPLFLELLQKAKEGDTSAQSELFERYCSEVEKSVHRTLARDLRIGRPWIQSRFSTGDVVQDVFRSVLADLGSFQGTTRYSFEGYLAMVVRNRLVDAIRFHEAERRDGRRGQPALVDDDHASSEPTPQKHTQVAEEEALFLECLAELPERDQLLVRARIEELGSFRDLAEQLGYSSTTAARRAFDAARARIGARLTRGKPNARRSTEES